MRNIFPRNISGLSCAERGSITATTPSVARNKASSLRGVIFSLSSSQANNSTNAGVADVTKDPLPALDSFVPKNCKLSDMPYPTKPTPRTCHDCLREIDGKPLNRRIIANVIAPRINRSVTNENGGMISNTTLLTTYIPPQMLAAPSPQINPRMVLLISHGL